MRKLAAGAGVLSMTLLIINLSFYNHIPQDIPVLRGIVADKTLLLSIRVLIINMLTLAAFLILANSIHRVQQEAGLNIYGAWILGFIMVKMTFECIGLFYERFFIFQMYLLLAGIVFLLAYGLIRHRNLFRKEFWEPVRFYASEKFILAILLITYIAVNIPVVSIVFSH
jgi:hypothetical protein